MNILAYAARHTGCCCRGQSASWAERKPLHTSKHTHTQRRHKQMVSRRTLHGMEICCSPMTRSLGLELRTPTNTQRLYSKSFSLFLHTRALPSWFSFLILHIALHQTAVASHLCNSDIHTQLHLKLTLLASSDPAPQHRYYHAQPLSHPSPIRFSLFFTSYLSAFWRGSFFLATVPSERGLDLLDM